VDSDSDSDVQKALMYTIKILTELQIISKVTCCVQSVEYVLVVQKAHSVQNVMKLLSKNTWQKKYIIVIFALKSLFTSLVCSVIKQHVFNGHKYTLNLAKASINIHAV
jgi:hypothetical protein